MMQDTLAKILKQDFKSFLLKSFYTLHHDQQFVDNWHLDLLSAYLEAIAYGQIKRLIINIPPRSLKSICASVSWPAWILARSPTKKIISASYSQLLSIKHSLDCRKIMQSEWYRQYFPASTITSGENNKNKFVTTHNGFRLSTSIGGTLTGEGADFLIVDDPLTPMQALSKAFRHRVNTWFEQTFCSRLDDQKKGAILIVMQRLHVKDLSGFIMHNKPNDWVILKLPLIAEHDQEFKINKFHHYRNKGTYLHPLRTGASEIEKIKNTFGSYAFSAQYQQNPIPIDGGIIQRSWVQYYLVTPQFSAIYQSWDCAIKTGVNSDFSVCTTWGIFEQQYYLIDVLQEKLDYSALKRTVLTHAAIFQATAILIEDKASGQQLIQELNTSGLNIIRYTPKFDKITRLAITANIFEAQRIFIPKTKEWVERYLTELTLFPNTEHDDQVDSTTQFLQWIEKKQNQTKMMPIVRTL